MSENIHETKTSDGKPIPNQNKDQKSDTDEVSRNTSEDYYTDILSSDSDDSETEEYKQYLMCEHSKKLEKNKSISTLLEPEKLKTDEEETLQRMMYYSLYMKDNYDVPTKPTLQPRCSEGYENFQSYSAIEAYAKDIESQNYILEDYDAQEFEKILTAGIKDDIGLDDIDGNISIRTLAERNYEVLKMDGPTRKIGLIFNYRTGDELKIISNNFRDFMKKQIKDFTYIGGALLLYEEIGIQFIEGSEYVLLRHFPKFFESEFYKKILVCKVLGVEELSAMKSFKQYACYKATPPVLKEALGKKITTYKDSIKFLKKLGKLLNIFLKFAYDHEPNIFDDNKLPENIIVNLPPKEYLEFALKGDWTPGLRLVEDWFYNEIVITMENDDAEFVWPPRSDHLPVHILHPSPEEDENLRKATIEKTKYIKLPHPKVIEPIEEKQKVQQKDSVEPKLEKEGGDSVDLLDEEFEFPTEKKIPEDLQEEIKKYNSQSSLIDFEEINTDLEDF